MANIQLGLSISNYIKVIIMRKIEKSKTTIINIKIIAIKYISFKYSHFIFIIVKNTF